MTSWNLIGFPKVGNQRNFSRGSPAEVFLGKGVLKLSSKSKGEHPCRKAILIKLQSNFIEITLQHRCSPVNLLHIFWTLFPKNISGGLLLFQKAAILEENSAIDLKENKGLLYGRCDQRIKFRFYLIPCRVVGKKPIFSYNISLANTYLFKVKNRDTRKVSVQSYQQKHQNDDIVNFEEILHTILVFPLLTSNKQISTRNVLQIVLNACKLKRRNNWTMPIDVFRLLIISFD